MKRILIAASILACGIVWAASPSGSSIPIIDASGNSWAVVGGVVQQNGKNAAFSQNVISLAYCGGKIYQENNFKNWWVWNGTTWIGTTNPAALCLPSSSSSSSSGGSSGSGSSSSSSGGSSSSSSSSGTTSSSSGSSSGPVAFGIQRCGNRLCDLNGNKKTSTIWDGSGLETNNPARWPGWANAGAPYWNKVKAAGFNTIRVPLNEASWLGYAPAACTKPNAGQLSYQATVQKVVADATSAGLYTILDLHWGQPDNNCPIGQPAYADAAHSIAFWQSIAAMFKNNPAVIFEIFNETFGSNNYNNWIIQTGSTYAPGKDALCMLNGCTAAPFLAQNNSTGQVQTADASGLAAGSQAMVNAIRAQGAPNMILAPTIGWDGEIEDGVGVIPVDPIMQIGVAWHVYGYNKGQTWPLAILNADYPIVITETQGLSSIGGFSWTQQQGIGCGWWLSGNTWAGGALTWTPVPCH